MDDAAAAKRIMIVESSPHGSRDLKHGLEKITGIATLGPISAPSALEAIKNNPPDLLIFRLEPGGTEAPGLDAGSIRKQFGPPIVYVGTPRQLDRLEKEAGPLGVLGLAEPYSDRELKNVIHSGLFAAAAWSSLNMVENDLRLYKEQLMEASYILDTALDGVPDVIGVHDGAGEIRRFNAAGYRFLNFTPETAKGKRCAEISGQDALCRDCLVSKCLADPQPESVEKYLEDQDIWLDCRVFPVFDSSGNLFRVLEHLRDITALKKAAVALRESESRFRSVVENSHDGIVIIDDQFAITYFNEEFLQLLDYSPRELLGRDFRDFLAEETKHVAIGNYLTRQQGGAPPKRYEFMIRRKNGARRWVETSSSIMVDFRGKKQTVAQLLDVSARKLAEAALRENQAYNNMLFQSHRTAMVVMDPETARFLDCNPAALKIYGLSSKEEVTGKTPIDVSFPVQYDGRPSQEKARALIRQCLEQGSVEFEWLHQRPDGVPWDAAVHLMLFQLGGRDLIQFSLHDITERKKAETALLAKTRELEAFFNCALEMLCIVDFRGRFRRFNREWTKALGYEPAEFEKMQFMELVHPDDVETTLEKIEELKAQKPVLAFSNRNRCKDGSYRWFEWRSYPQGDLVYAAARDMTEHKKAEDELAAQKAFLQKIIDADPNFIFVKDRESRFVLVNLAVAEVYGASRPEELIGRSDAHFNRQEGEVGHFHLDDLEVIEQKKEKFIPDEKITAADGRVLWLQTAKRPLIEPDGSCFRLLGVSADITGRKQAEEELRRLRNFLSNIIDSMPSVLIGVDPKGKVTQWNHWAELETGVPAPRAAGRSIDEVFPRLAPLLDKVHEAMQERRSHHESNRVGRRESETKFEDVTIYPLVANGVEGAVIRLDDVTDRVRLEEMMVQSERMLSVGGLAAGIAHEINNPLAGIMQNAQMLEKRLMDDLPANRRAAEEAGTSLAAIRAYMDARGVVNMLGNINESGRRAASIVKNMLGFARRGENVIQRYNMAEIVDQALELARADFSLKNKYDFKKIEIIREFDHPLPMVPCERNKIQQVLLNLFKNGAEAMSAGLAEGAASPRIVIRLKNQNDAIQMEIEDNGPGMDEKTRRRVFEPFFTTKPVGKGTGLGLSVSYFIITENHGGALGVESSPGHGAKFLINLPLKREKS
ncbi:MAG: PAS domain S-box protein [Pseudomonadota bacterium]